MGNKINTVLLLLSLMVSGCTQQEKKPEEDLSPQSTFSDSIMRITEQGSFAVGGKVLTDFAGNTLHGDHAYVFYQKPADARALPLVFVHGTGQFSKTWETPPDGREGFQKIFLKRSFATYIIDQPRRGRAGRSTEPSTVVSKHDEQMWFNRFRLGIWPNYFEGVQFVRDEESLNQYFRQMAPNTGPFDLNIVSDAVATLFDKIEPAFWSFIRKVEPWIGRHSARRTM